MLAVVQSRPLHRGGSSHVSVVTPSSSAGPGAGETTLEWDFSSEGTLRGDCVPVGGSGVLDPSCSSTNGRTKIVITFEATINDTYSGGNRVEHRDNLNNTTSVSADAISPLTLASTGATYSDTSSASLTIVSGTLTKTIYAVNGSTILPDRLQPGDDVTYRLQYTVPSTDFQSVRIDDFLPLPMFTASQVTTFNASDPLGTIPVAGEANFGSNETLYGYLATSPVLTNESGNVVRFEWPSTHDPSNQSRRIDIMFTVTITDAAYAPGLYVTNQATVTENNIQTSFASNSIQQIELEVPELSIEKGVVNSSNSADVYAPTTVGPVAFTAPGSAGLRFAGTISSAGLSSNPINSDVSSVDAGDIITFAVAIQNSGKGDAYETRIKDTLPAGLIVPGGGINLHVSDGTGASISHTDVGGGTGLFDQGIELSSVISNGLSASGANVVILTYDLEVASSVDALHTYTNNAQITKFTAKPAGVNYMNNQSSYQDSAIVTIATPSVSKSVTATSNGDTSGNNVVVGEEMTYTATITVPEGILTSASITDTLDACLAVTGLDSLTASSGVTSSLGSFSTVLSGASVSSVGAGAANAGRQITMSLGTITNSNSSDGSPETITFIYRVVPINASTCARGNARNNQLALSWDTSSTVSGSATDVIIQEPTVTTTKTYTVAGGDAGDTKTIQLVIGASSGTNFSPAYNVSTTDDLNSTGFQYVGNITHVSGVAPTTSGESGGIVTFTYDQLNPGQTSTVRFDVQIKDTVQANSTQANTAQSRYTSMPGSPSGLNTYNTLGCERTGNTGDCGTTENDYLASSTANLTINNVNNVKSQVSTSEADSSASGVLVGEIVRYRLVSRIPEGTQNSYVLRDAIPNGMSYMNDGTTKAAFVFNSSFTSSTITNPTVNFTGDETTVAGITPTYVLSGSEISAGANVNGTDVDFNFGNIVNTDNDSNFEYIVVEFNALIRNESTNVRGTTLSNNYSTRINGAAISGTTSANSSVTVQEPQVAITKTVTTAPVDAGDAVAYTIVLTNTSGTNVETGYEWNFTDTLNTHLQFVSVSDITAPGYASVDTSATAGQNVSVVIDKLDPGGSVSFIINATVRDTAPANFIVPNTGSVSVTSLPGSNGTTSNATGSSTPGSSGSTTGEEIYTGNSSASTTLGTPSIDKQSPVAGSEYSIGQTVVYPILVTVPEGVVQNVTISDFLPLGLRYESSALDLSGFTGSFVNDPPLVVSPASIPGNDGEDVVLDFGSISTPGTTGTNDTFIVNITARVMDIPANYEGQTLSNTASLTYTNPNTGFAVSVIDSVPIVITVREPRLTLAKSLVAGDPRIVGDQLDYTVDITSDGSTPVYEWHIDDTLPAHTTLNPGLACVNDVTPVSVSSSVTSGVLAIEPNPLAGSTLPVGETITCTYSLTIDSSAIAGTTYTNTADVDWRNSAAASGYGRSYVDAVSTLQDGSQDTDSASFTMDAIGITKDDGGRTHAVIGDVVNYTLTINAPSATLGDFSVVDALPAGLIFNNDSDITGTGSVSPSLTGPNDGSGPTAVTWDFGTVSHDGSTITITYSARVANISSTQDGTTLSNGATVHFTPELGTEVTASNSDSFIVQEPLLLVEKSNNALSARFGETVAYTLAVSHDVGSTASAYDILVSDVLPAGLTYVTGSANVPTGWTVTQAGQTLEFRGSSLVTSATATITYDAEITLAPTSGNVLANLNNTATLSWTSLSGSQTGERDGSGGTNDYESVDASSITVNGIDLRVVKDDQTATILPNGTIVYLVDYENAGSVDAVDVELVENVPDNTIFDLGSSTAGWSCADGSTAGTECRFNLTTVGASVSGSVEFAVRVLGDDEMDPQAATIENTISITSPASNGPDVDEDNNSYTESTPLEIADLSVTKTESVDPVYISHDYSYTLEIHNDGPDMATNITLSDPLPSGVDYRGYSAPNASCSFVDPVFSCTLSSLASGDTEVIILDVTGSTPGDKINTVTVVVDQHDPNLDNNSDTESTLVDPADLALTKSVNKTSATVGETVTYSLDIVNNGPDVATNVQLSDMMPAGLQTIAMRSSQGSCSLGTPIVCVLGTMNNGATAHVEIDAKVTQAGTFVNTASTTIAEYDPNPSNNTSIGVQLTAVQPLSNTGSKVFIAQLFAMSIIAVVVLTRRKRDSR